MEVVMADCRSAVERARNNPNGFRDFRTENGSSQDQNLVVIAFFVPRSLDSGRKVKLSSVPNRQDWGRVLLHECFHIASKYRFV